VIVISSVTLNAFHARSLRVARHANQQPPMKAENVPTTEALTTGLLNSAIIPLKSDTA
jgi:hypothetical protein